MRTPPRTALLLATLALSLFMMVQTSSAQNIIVNTAMLEDLDITPDNMWNFQVQSMEAKDMRCVIEGNIVFKNSGHSIKFKFKDVVKPGLNQYNANTVTPEWTFSSSALRELFMDYKVLPEGTYKYCVTLTFDPAYSEQPVGSKVDDCVFKQSKDLFSITLVDPENGAKIYEYNPMLSWVATYPFLNELTYRIRVAEIKEGQNTENAIARNNPIYSENNIVPNSIVYPVYAKPLIAWQPYAWTVDAYYKGILLGGAQPWKFMIVEDSVYKSLPKESSYIDINESGSNKYYAVGTVKIKFSENDFLQNELKIKFIKNGNELKKAETLWPISHGVNFKTIDLTDYNFKHGDEFFIEIEYKNVKAGQNNSKINFKYVNPDFVK
ncbi:MAG: hypothetical protein JST70_05410 [Bacteroidetes bacterium]|nr:hypothetical protein [Bacteroidota bacterium]